MTLREHLQAIYDAHDRLTPELVVETARPKNHPLHGYVFDCPPSEAAEAWYRHRAHELIRRVKVTYAPAGEEGEGVTVRAFHAVRSEAGHVYEPAETVRSDPFLRELVLRDAEREWRALYARYGHLREFLNLVTDALSEVAA